MVFPATEGDTCLPLFMAKILKALLRPLKDSMRTKLITWPP